MGRTHSSPSKLSLFESCVWEPDESLLQTHVQHSDRKQGVALFHTTVLQLVKPFEKNRTSRIRRFSRLKFNCLVFSDARTTLNSNFAFGLQLDPTY